MNKSLYILFVTLFSLSPLQAKENYLSFYYAAPKGTLTATDGVKLQYKVFEVAQEKGAIVLVTGWTETHLKYAELIHQLVQQGYSVYSVDNRGMGFSQRLSKNPQRVHVNNFYDYVSDLGLFIEQVVNKKSHRNYFLLSHSTGGLISALYLAHYPHIFNAAVYSAPLFQVNTGKIPERVAYALASSATHTGWGDTYLPFDGDTSYEKASDFNKQTTTHSPERWKHKIGNWQRHPEILQGGSSYRWLKTTLEHTWLVQKDMMKNVKVPSLIFQAGLDSYVMPEGQKIVCSQMPSCELKRFDNAFHEFFLEKDEIRTPVLQQTLDFFSKHLH